MLKRAAYLLALLLFAGGCVFVSRPLWEGWRVQSQGHRAIERFFAVSAAAAPGSVPSGGTEAAAMPYAGLYEEMRAYNQRIYEERQQSLCDAWSYQTNVFDFDTAGLPDDMIGWLNIPAMECELPLYIGANTDNMAKGAVVLSQTSMPLGGENTNCVIAAHRGYRGAAMFREIERLQEGDTVEVTTLWETLTYQVVKCIVIDPTDIEAVKIMEGQDLLTLVTCHPYTRNYQRYVVYCARQTGPVAEQSGEEATPVTDAPPIPYEGVAFEPSAGAIRQERRLTWLGVGVMGAAVLTVVVILFCTRRKRAR